MQSAGYEFGQRRAVHADGHVVSDPRDPPGQGSVYIPPGDTKRETYRLATFRDFPRNIRLNTCLFASHGFSYTGYRDRVKCFSCGQAVEKWEAHDDIGSSRYHKENCAFANGTDSTNIPIHPHLQGSSFGRDDSQASTSYSRQRPPPSSTSVNLERERLSNSRVQNSSPTLSSAIFHQPRSAAPSTVLPSLSRDRSGNVQNPSLSIASNQTQESSESDLNAIFPCLHPVNPHMRSLEARLQTFADNMPLWSANNIRATAREVAIAGMFYLGERDRVKCFYCNGGLQNWERDDIPWEEHAKWFPMCEFLLRSKGPDYVHSVVGRFPNLRRPNLFNPAVNRRSVMRTTPRHVQRQPVIVDPRDELREINRMIDEEMRNSELVAQAQLMGFNEPNIRTALKRQFELHNSGFSDFESLVDSLLSLTETQSTPSSSSQHPLSGGSATVSSSASMRNELQELVMSRNCKICRVNQAEIVLLPCGHLACCLECGRNVSVCPVCSTSVRDRIRSYVV